MELKMRIEIENKKRLEMEIEFTYNLLPLSTVGLVITIFTIKLHLDVADPLLDADLS